MRIFIKFIRKNYETVGRNFQGDLESLWYNRIMRPFRLFSLEIFISIYTTDNPLFYTLGKYLVFRQFDLVSTGEWNPIGNL